MRKVPIINGEYYHIFNRSIAGFHIFNDANDFKRMVEMIELFSFKDFRQSYANFDKLTEGTKISVKTELLQCSDRLVDIIAFCLMPTHPHLILKQNFDNGISSFVSRTLNSYSRYFNTKHHRKGPLWEGHFTNVLVKDDIQLLHLTRYIHLNPVSAGLVEKTEEWPFSSYNEYLSHGNHVGLCRFRDILKINSSKYKKFVEDQIGYQRELSKIKHLLAEDYSG